MPKITIRPQRVSDAKRFFDILQNPNFKYFNCSAKTVEDERKWLKKTKEKAKSNFEHNFTILYGRKVVGGIGFKINQHRKHIGELGYFLDEDYWNKGIMTRAVRQMERLGFNKLGLVRIEILMQPANIASEKVAKKCGYRKEGRMRSVVNQKGEFRDCWIYAKVV